jgi:tRNA G18 (ribose-2'-O)-methylase SpoU
VIVALSAESDPALSPYRNVGADAVLRRLGLFVAEGRLVVRRVVEDSRFAVESVLATPSALTALADVLTDTAPFPVYVTTQPVVNAVTGFDFHRGCLALVRRPEPAVSLGPFALATRLLALERIGNPDNVGGLFRVAGALGADGVLLDHDTSDPLYRKAIRTSMGATLRLPSARVASWASLRAELGTSCTLAALTPAPDATPIDRFEPSGRPLVLLLGAEGDGLRAETLALADVRLRIPIDARFDSLNVVVAAGIALTLLARPLSTP